MDQGIRRCENDVNNAVMYKIMKKICDSVKYKIKCYCLFVVFKETVSFIEVKLSVGLF